MELPILGLILIFSSNAFANSTSDRIYFENRCDLLMKCSPEGEKVWVMDYEQKICRVFSSSCELAYENCKRRIKCQPELIATTEEECQKCFPRNCTENYEAISTSEKMIVIDRCNLMFRCSMEGPKVWAIDYEQKICRVFPNSCHLANENCNRRNRCQPQLIATTQDQCQKCFPTKCPEYYEAISKSEIEIVANYCSLLFRCASDGEIVWAIDYEQKICRVFSNGCQLGIENCNRRNRCDPELEPTTQEECQKYCPEACPEYYDPVCGYYKDKQMTFTNTCDLNHYVCKTGENFTILYYGKCEG